MKKKRCPAIVVGGTQSGVGKTSVTLGIVRSLTRRGLRVQTFKVGPDFLDPTYLALASGRPCYNLDGWMCGKKYVRELFEEKTNNVDIAIIEGVMGLFDGASPLSIEGSTAEIAALLDIPVLLVVNAHGMAGSIAPLVKGYAEFKAEVAIAGVIANHIGSEHHAELLSEALESHTLPELVGGIPRGVLPELPSRHLGLVAAGNRSLMVPAANGLIDTLTDALENHVDRERLLAIAGVFPEDHHQKVKTSQKTAPKNRLRIGIAQDEAFHFYYEDLLEILQKEGADIVPFSPLRDEKLPSALNSVMIGGGYPELHAEALAKNEGMKRSLKDFATSNHPIYAECGGLMYLSSELQTPQGNNYPMLGIFPGRTRMLSRKKTLGYVEVTLDKDSLWGNRGDQFRGHEFHYSELVEEIDWQSGWEKIYHLKRRKGEESLSEGYQKGKILVSYAHLHFAAHPKAIRHFIEMITQGKQ